MATGAKRSGVTLCFFSNRNKKGGSTSLAMTA
jgi:hypothetical protein